jgi:quinol monooxygenase YgiN
MEIPSAIWSALCQRWEFDSPPRAPDHAAMLKSILIAVMSAALATAAVAENEFRHVVLFKFKPGATAEQIKEVEKAFAELPKKIDAIQGYEWGTSESVEGLNDGFTHCFFVTFKDKAGLEAYLPHEAHKAFGAKLKPILEKALVFDYTAKKD